MTRKKLIRSAEHPYHVTIRTNNKEWFDIPMKKVWGICLQSMTVANYKYHVKIEAFVLMSNHYHLLLYTPDANLDKFMNVLNSSISREIRDITGRINRIFGDRYRWQIIKNETYYKNVIRYIFQNPRRGNIVHQCETYPYSTLYYQVNNISLPFVVPKRFVGKEFLDFINQENKMTFNLESIGAIE